jgi:hypothetical protein
LIAPDKMKINGQNNWVLAWCTNDCFVEQRSCLVWIMENFERLSAKLLHANDKTTLKKK